MAASAGDAHPYPIYNARYRVTFPILDADGDLVTGAASLDSEASQDGGTFADCTNEATELATSSGMYYLDLIATELDTKCTAIIVKTSTAGAKTTPLVLYPRRLPQLRTGTAQAGAATTITLDSGASAVNSFYLGCIVNITNNSPANALGQARRITGYVGSTKVATVEAAWGTNPDSTSTFEILLTEEACAVREWAGAPIADPTIAGVPEVDVTHFGGTAGTFASGRPEVNVSHAAGTAVQAAAGRFQVDVEMWNGTAVPAEHTAGYPVVTFKAATAGTADSGTTVTLTDAARTETDTDYWKGMLLVFTSGNLQGMARVITAFEPVNDTITFSPATPQSVGTHTYEIWPVGDFLRPTATGRTLDVSPGGEAGIDWSNVGQPSATINLMNTTINLCNTTTNLTNLPAITTNWLTAAGLAADAVTEIQAGLSTLTAAQVNAEVVDVIRTDTVAQLAAVPAANATLHEMVQWVFALARNEINQTAAVQSLRNDGDTGNIATAATSDDGTTFERSKWT